MNTKQVIVMRTKYPDGKGGTFGLRTGKMIAQACHASMAFLSRCYDGKGRQLACDLSSAEINWFNDSFAKICCKVETEQELLEIHEKAIAAGLKSHLITDSGRTEFHGTPTVTCVAIGPDQVEKIDAITGNLALL